MTENDIIISRKDAMILLLVCQHLKTNDVYHQSDLERLHNRFEFLSNRIVGALSAPALSADKMAAFISNVMRGHQLLHTVSAEGASDKDFMLTDMLTPAGEKTIALGVEEVDHLAGCVAREVYNWLMSHNGVAA